MLAPKLEARMLQELAVKPDDRILEVGTGSGYMTALLAKRGAHVYSVEIIPEFSAQAAAKLARARHQQRHARNRRRRARLGPNTRPTT